MELDVQFPQIDNVKMIANICINKTKVEGSITIPDANRLYPLSTYIFVENNGETCVLNVAKNTDDTTKNMLFELKNGVSAIPLIGIMEFMADKTDLKLNFDKDFDGYVWVVSSVYKSKI